MAPEDLDALLAEQTAYYRARAGEYDETSAFDAAARADLVAALEDFAPRGHVLELACGTGQWTGELAKNADEVTAVEAAPEMLAINGRRNGAPNVSYLQADLFAWAPTDRYDVVFFSAWLSHVPPQLFESFWALVASCLKDDGRVFAIDELPAVAAIERRASDTAAPTVERRLTTGAQYRAVKVFYDPPVLKAGLPGSGGTSRSAPLDGVSSTRAGRPPTAIRKPAATATSRPPHRSARC
jgi:SAM-dependent methyltransferase